MKTPNKIYINTLNIDKGDNHWFIDRKDNSADKKYNVEYLRKDALIEWAREEIGQSKAVECISEVAYEEGRRQVALNLIEKLNSM